MWWHEQPWPRFESIDKNLPVVVPLGSIEQHGHHLPLCVDSEQVTAIATRAEAALGAEALFLPTLWLGCSEHHMDFPGTISVRPSLYSENLKSIARSILRAGFWRILFLNGHGGNETPGAQALTELVGEDDRADGSYLVFSSWWQLGREAIAPQRHGLISPGISHACEYETSLMLALRPELVDLAAASEAPPVVSSPWLRADAAGAPPRVRQFRRFHRLTASGSLGRPSQGTAEKGRSMLEALVNEVLTFIRDFATWPNLPAIGGTSRGASGRSGS